MQITNEQRIKEKALSLGFYACGITSVPVFDKESNALTAWIENNYHAQMDFITQHSEKRKNPALLFDGLKSVIVVLLNYQNPTYLSQKKSNYTFVQYALGKDYHIVVKEKLDKLSQYLVSLFPQAHTRSFVDTAPIFEKSLAVQAGLGWIGKNTLLINPKGSQFFIGEIFTTVELQSDKPFSGIDCGSCDKCIKACPTNALKQPHLLDANRCLSYQSIERKQIKWEKSLESFAYPFMYGCDICQQVCPFNTMESNTLIPEFTIKNKLLSYNDTDWEQLTEEDFQRIFSDSAVKRIGYLKFMENVKVAKKMKIKKETTMYKNQSLGEK